MKKIIPLSSALGTATLAALLILGNAGQALAATSYTRDLTLGSSGSDVSSLQTFLISKGFSIPSGATGYFGNQTKAALASYQAAHSIVPAAGYFGAITRASVASSEAPVTPGTPDDTDSGSDLSGGEADLRSFNLTSGNDLAEGETDVEIASVKFNVKGGDVRAQRMTLEFTATNASLNTQPWRYVDALEVYNGSKKIGSVDASSRDDWDKNGTTYSIDIPLNSVIKSGRSVELSVRADAQGSIDSRDLAQTFSVVVPDNGIRAVDSKKIQNYTGSDSDSITLGFDTADNGKISLRESSDNPESGVIVADSSKNSDKTEVLVFEMRNGNDADALLDELTVRVDAAFAGSAVTGEDVDDIIRRATLKLDGKTYQADISADDSDSYEGSLTFENLDTVIDGDDSVEGILTVELAGSANRYDSGAQLSFDVLAADVEAEGDRTGDTTEVTGSVTGNLMTVVADGGINLAGRTNTAKSESNSNDPSSSFGTYTLKFDVKATGDDVFVPRQITVNDSASSTTGVNLVTLGNAFTGDVNAVLTSDAKVHNSDFYIVREGATKTFTATVVLNPDAAGHYQVGIDFVHFSPSTASLQNLQKLEIDENKAQFNTDPIYIQN